MSKLIQLFLISSFLILGSPSAYASNICEDIFNIRLTLEEKSDSPFHKQITKKSQLKPLAKAIDSLFSDPTNLRQESKFVVSSEIVKVSMKKLEKDLSKFKIKIKDRDPRNPGFVNVTLTTYLHQFRIDVDQFLKLFDISPSERSTLIALNKGPYITLKLRLRKYGQIEDSKEVDFANIILSESSINHSFFEFKLKNPKLLAYEGVVGKIRAYAPDYITNKVTHKSQHADFLENYNSYQETVLQLNSKNPKTLEQDAIFVRSIFSFIKKSINLGHDLSPKFQMLYERLAYKIGFENNSGKNKEEFEIQMTVDESIKARLMDEAKTSIEAYTKGVNVVEIKTPLTYVNYSLKKKRISIKGYRVFLTFKKEMDEAHIEKYPKNKGKKYNSKLAYENKDGDQNSNTHIDPFDLGTTEVKSDITSDSTLGQTFLEQRSDEFNRDDDYNYGNDYSNGSYDSGAMHPLY